MNYTVQYRDGGVIRQWSDSPRYVEVLRKGIEMGVVESFTVEGTSQMPATMPVSDGEVN